MLTEAASRASWPDLSRIKDRRARKPEAAGIQGRKAMHPIWVEMLQKPVGWLTIIGGIILIGMPFAVRAFIRKQMREEDKQAGKHGDQ